VCGPNPGADARHGGGGVLDRVVQNPGSDEALGVTGVVQQRRDLEGMHDETGGV
jgi:hypothetical protein